MNAISQWSNGQTISKRRMKKCSRNHNRSNVSPESSNGLFWKQDDLILLNISKNISIVFYAETKMKTRKHMKKKKQSKTK